MKLLCVIPSYFPAFQYGGPIACVHGLNKALVKKGIDVTVYATNVNGSENLNVPTNQEVMVDEVKVYYFKGKKPRGYAFSPSMWKVMSIRVKDFDLLHIHTLYSFPTLVSTYYARKYKIPYIIAAHGMLIKEMIEKKSRFKKEAYISLFEKRNIEKASGVHCTVENEKQDIQKFGFNIKNYFVVPNGIDLEEFNIFPPKGLLFEKFSHLKDKKIILFFSRVNWKKGLDDLIPAFADIANRRDDVHLLIVGPDNEGYGKKVKTLVKDYGIMDKVTFTGMLTGKDKLMVLQDSDIFVLPSYSENFGVAVIEAMFRGLPVVITNKVGISDDVKCHEAGVVIEKSKDNLVAAIDMLFDNKALCRKMGEKGKRLVEERFTCDRVGDEMIKVYKSITKHG